MNRFIKNLVALGLITSFSSTMLAQPKFEASKYNEAVSRWLNSKAGHTFRGRGLEVLASSLIIIPFAVYPGASIALTTYPGPSITDEEKEAKMLNPIVPFTWSLMATGLSTDLESRSIDIIRKRDQQWNPKPSEWPKTIEGAKRVACRVSGIALAMGVGYNVYHMADAWRESTQKGAPAWTENNPSNPWDQPENN